MELGVATPDRQVRKMGALGRLDEELKRAALIRSLTDYLLSHANNRV